ncbi:Hypothetical protein GSB_151328, partial [Giardia duodenalis]
VTLLVNACSVSGGVQCIVWSSRWMTCDATRHALCGAQGCARATEVRDLCGAMGVLEDAEGGTGGGELSHTGGVGLQHAVRVGGVLLR